MRFKILLSAVCLMLSTVTIAQTIDVKVVVKNDKDELVSNATAQVLNTVDSSVLFVKTIKNNTSFSLNKNSTYLLRISAVGNSIVYKNIQTGDVDTLINVTAQTTPKNLDAVTVTSRKPLIKQEDDKTIVDAEVLANSSTNAYEVLEKTPGTIVDQDGNVYLNSATPAIIYINGREVRLSAADLTSLLKSLPAGSVSKIEILRTPSAKFDAASSGGIVNIVLKKGVKLGTNGSVDVSHFQGVYATETIGFNVNKSENKLNTYFSYNYTNRTNFNVLTSSRTNTDTLFTQYAFTKFPTTTHYAGGGLDYQINKKWNIGYDVRFTANNNQSFVNNDINIFKAQNKFGQNRSDVQNTGLTFYLGNTISTKYKIDSAGSEWTNSLDYSFFKIDNNQTYQNINIQPARKTLFGDGAILNKKNIVAFKSDLILKTKNKWTLEFGLKLNIALSKNNALYFSDTSTGKYLNTFQTNGFKYTEDIGAVYAQVSKTFKGFTIKPGLRLEYTDIAGRQLIPKDTTFTINRTNLFPYIYLRKGIGKLFGLKFTGNLIYRRSITRPFYEALNPFPRYADQYTYDVGNPNLRPQFTNNYEFNITANEYPVLSVGLNDIKDIFTTLTYQKDNILFRTYDNLGTNKEVYLRLIAGVPPGKKYFFYAGTQLNVMNYKGKYNGSPFTYRRSSWNVFMFHNYKPTPTFNISLNGWMRIKGVYNFFETKTFGTLNISANKSILKKKMNVILSVNDLLRTNITNFNIDVPNFIGEGRQYSDTRRVGLTLKYNFGLKPKVEKRQGFDVPQEAN